MVGFGLILALAGIILLIAGAAQAVQNQAFRNAQTVTGTVLDKHSHNRKNGRAYLLRLSYSVDGTEYERDIGVQKTEYEAIEAGGQYQVLYRPEKPRRIIRPQSTSPRIVQVVLILGAVLIASGAAMVLLGRSWN